MEWKELEKLTVAKLREEALKHDQLKGVHGKTKAQLLGELAEVLGIEKPKEHYTEQVVHTKGDLKKKIRELKGQRDKTVKMHEHKRLHEIRREIHQLKRRIRRIEHQNAKK